jgi:Ca2+-binding EF-hand superfamily protein
MNHRSKLTIAIAAMMAGAVFGPASFAHSTDMPTTASQQFQRSDTNQDGQVSRREFDNYWKQQFQTADTNQDGKLSRQECEMAVRNTEGSQFSQAKFDKMWNDVSQNGHITSSQDLAYHDQQFSKADANDNGKLSLAETRNAVQSGNQDLASL